MAVLVRDQQNAIMEEYEMTDMDCDGSPRSSNAQIVGAATRTRTRGQPVKYARPSTSYMPVLLMGLGKV